MGGGMLGRTGDKKKDGRPEDREHLDGVDQLETETEVSTSEGALKGTRTDSRTAPDITPDTQSDDW
ncbi:MAG: hypothetical protein ACTHYM_12965 [Actinomycetaceae bacterium]